MNSKIERCQARLEWWCPSVTSLFGRNAKILKRHLPLLSCQTMEIMDRKKLELLGEEKTETPGDKRGRACHVLEKD